MDNLLEELYEKYDKVLRNMMIGHPLSKHDLREMWDIIHNRYFIRCETDAPLVYTILEKYEYM